MSIVLFNQPKHLIDEIKCKKKVKLSFYWIKLIIIKVSLINVFFICRL